MSKRMCGIYSIRCISNQKVYIGSSKNISERWKEHKRNLDSKNHPNFYLQSAWNKYGPDVFIWEVVEFVSVDELYAAELKWFGKTRCCDSRYGFNIATDPLAPMRGRILTTQTRLKMGMARIGNTNALGYHHTEVARRKISEANRGKKLTEAHRRKISIAPGHRSEETRRKISEAVRMNWELRKSRKV